MAKNSQVKDPTEIALSAIQDALRIGNATSTDDSQQMSLRPGASRGSAMPSPEDIRAEPLITDEFPEPQFGRYAANDDRQMIGAMLQVIQKGRPRRNAYAFATLFSGLWIAAAGLLAFAFRPALEAMINQQTGGALALAGLAAVFFAPLMLFYFLASVAWRSQELTMIAQSMAQMALRFSEPESMTGDGMVTVGQAIRREVAAMGDGVERAIARAGELEALVSTEVAALERAYSNNESRIRVLLQDITEQRKGIVSQAEQIESAISNVKVDLRDDIASISEAIANRVNNVAESITTTLQERGEHITSTLSAAGDNMIVTLGEHGGDLLDRLEEATNQTAQAVLEASEQLTANLNFKTDHVYDEFAELADRIHDMLNERVDLVTREFDDKSGAIVDGIAARAENVHEVVKNSGDNLLIDLELRGNDIAGKIEQAASRLAEQLLAGSEMANEALDVSVNSLMAKVMTQTEATHETLNMQLGAFEGLLKERGTELAEKLARDSTTLGALITRHISEFDRTVKTYGGEIVDRLGQHTQAVSDNLKAGIDTFDGNVTTHGGQIIATIDQRLAEFQGLFDGRAASLDASLETKIKTFDGTVSARFDGIRDSLETHANGIATTVETQITRFEGLLDTRVDAAATRILESGDKASESLAKLMVETSESIQTNARNAQQSLLSLSGEVSSRITTAASTATSQVHSSATDIERIVTAATDALGFALTGKVEAIASGVEQQTMRLTDLIDGKRGLLVEAIGAKSNELGAAITTATETALRTIDGHGGALTNAMSDKSAEFAFKINAASETATSAVVRSLTELETSSRASLERSREVSATAVSEIQKTSTMLRTDTIALFERLHEGNILLQEVLTGAHENLNSLEHALVTRVANFVSTMNDVIAKNGASATKLEEQMNIFNQTTGGALDNLGALSKEFGDHGQALALAVQTVEQSNARTGETVTERNATLEALVKAIDLRTLDLDDRLTRFTTLLDESLVAAEERARDISAVVTETASGTSLDIGRQFEAVRMAVEDERRQTLEAMTEIYDSGTQEAGQMFQQAADKFAAIVHTMKDMSFDLHQQLEATRADLHRGVFEMPQEVAESTSQMRKVIVDQIEALAELNRIVARHGRGLDVAGVGRTPQREEESAMAIAGTPSRQPPPRLRDGNSASSLPPPDLGVTAGPRRTDAPPMSPASDPARDGWLSELLNRAESEGGDRDAPPPRPRTPPPQPARQGAGNPIDALSLDIVRLIDRDMAMEMWDRYQRGERKAFSKRVYTPAGQKAFDEVGRKYRADRNFKQTVDRYINEFERLLDEVARDERGPAALRKQLASEAGLVYTLLAHAAGRLG